MITIVCGPPCSGKSTYVAQHAGPDDLVIDHDAIAQELGSDRTHNHHAAFARQAELIIEDQLDNLPPDRDVWVIRSLPSAEYRRALADYLRADRIVVVTADVEDLHQRAQARPNPAATTRIIDWWLANFTEDDDMRSTTERGYGTEHQAVRKVWVEWMAEHGGVDCHAKVCFAETRYIDPDEPWDLGHTEDRTDWTGPEHRYCNRKEPQLRGLDIPSNEGKPKRWEL